MVAYGLNFLWSKFRKRKYFPNAEKSSCFSWPQRFIETPIEKIVAQFLPFSEDTIDILFALAESYRQQGDILSATKIHQRLIAENTLSHHFKAKALIELARDYLTAGMLDRAEHVLLILVEQKIALNEVLLLLMNLYQQTKEWGKAIAAAKHFEKSSCTSMAVQIMHYYCEEADAALNQINVPVAFEMLKQARFYEQRHPRVLILNAKILYAQGHALKAKKFEQKVSASYAWIFNEKEYLCQGCGFKVKIFVWQCPYCKAWDGVGPLKITAEN